MNRNASALAAAIAATLGTTGAADAATYPATLLSVNSYAGAGSSAAALDTSTATWSYDDVTNLLTSTGGTYNARFTIVPTTTLFRHSITGLVIGNGAAATATTYQCTEGNFGGTVGASLCGNYNFGGNFANESSTTWGPGVATDRTIGGDDMSIGGQQSLSFGYDNFSFVSWTGTTLILSNATCNPLAPGNLNGCATLGGLNQGYTWTLQAGPQTGGVPTATDDTASTRLNVATTPINVLANDSGFSTGTVTVDVGAPDQNGAVSITDDGAPCAAPCSVTDASTLRVILTPSAPLLTPTYVETFTYTVTKGADTDTGTVSVTVNNLVPVANNTTLTISTEGVTPANATGSFNYQTLAGNVAGDAPVTVDTTDGATGTVAETAPNLVYTPAADFFTGSDTFTYQFTDADTEQSATATVTVNIPNVSPTISDDSVTTEKNTPVDVDLTFTAGNGSLADHTIDIAFVLTAADGDNGTCEVNGTTLTYTPDADYVGADSCDVYIEDGDGEQDNASIDISVVEPPPPPTSTGLREDDGGSSADWLLLSLLGSGALIRRRRKA